MNKFLLFQLHKVLEKEFKYNNDELNSYNNLC